MKTLDVVSRTLQAYYDDANVQFYAVALHPAFDTEDKTDDKDDDELRLEEGAANLANSQSSSYRRLRQISRVQTMFSVAEVPPRT